MGCAVGDKESFGLRIRNGPVQHGLRRQSAAELTVPYILGRPAGTKWCIVGCHRTNEQDEIQQLHFLTISKTDRQILLRAVMYNNNNPIPNNVLDREMISPFDRSRITSMSYDSSRVYLVRLLDSKWSN